MPASVVLPSPGGPANSRWSAAWPAPAGRLEDDREVLLQLALADELVERAGPQAGLDATSSTSPAAPGRATRHARLRPEQPCSASRSSDGRVVAVVGSSRSASRTSSGRSRARRAPRARRPIAGAAPLPVAGRRRRSSDRARRAAPSARPAAAPRSSCRRRARGISAATSSSATTSTQRRRRVHREDRQRQRRADAVGADERLEARPLVARREAVQRLRVLADVVVDVEEAPVAVGSSSAERARRDA